MPDQKTQKVMIVTGASRGIGATVARLAAQRGYAVCINYNASEAAAQQVLNDIQSSGGRAIAVRADVSTSAGAAKLFGETDSRLGPPAALINNAGIIGGQFRLDTVEPERLEAVFAANVYSAFYCCREAVRRMSTRNGGTGGVIVNFSSAAARHGGMVNECHYASSKAAIDGLTVALAKEVGTEGVRVNSLRPGVIRTSIHDVHGGEATFKAVAPTIPLGRIGEVSEAAEAALWLASEASSYVHGAILDVSGGR